MDPSKVPPPLGTDLQYDILFRSYLNSSQRTQEAFSEIRTLIEQINTEVSQITFFGSTKSRFPGGAIFHKLFQRLLRRHLGSSLGVITRIESKSAMLASRLVDVWDSVYRHELEMDRRSLIGVLDRIAVVDALQIRLELLEEEISQLRQVG